MSHAMHFDLQLKALRTLMIRAPDLDWTQTHFVWCDVLDGLNTDFLETTDDLPLHVLMPQSLVAGSLAHCGAKLTFDGDVDELPTIAGFEAYTTNRQLEDLKRKQLANMRKYGKRHLPPLLLREWLHLVDQYDAGLWPFAAWVGQLERFVPTHPSLQAPLTHMVRDQQVLSAQLEKLALLQPVITHAALISVADQDEIYHLTMPTEDVAQLGEFVRRFSIEGGVTNDETPC